jgi:hypothetical protein
MPAEEYGYRIPADVEREDRILAGLTARQVAIMAAAGVVLWLAYMATRHLMALPVFAAIAFPFGAATVVLALGRRDGLALHQLALAAVRQARSPRKLALAPEGVTAPPAWMDAGQTVPLPAPLRLPARAIDADGLIDLGADGVAVICTATTVSFALRTPAEQTALVATFGRWLNSLSGPTQILVRAEDVDITPLISGLRRGAPTLPHPELEVAAREHADFLASLTARRDLLRRRVLIVLREPRPAGGTGRHARDGAGQRVLRRAEEATRALSAAGISLQILPGEAAATVLAACCNPWRPGPASSTGQAGPSAVITANGGT